MTDHMQLQRKTVGQTTDTPTSVMSSPVMSAPTATLQLAPEPPVQAEPKVESAESAPEQEPQSSMLSHDFGRISILPKLSVSQPNDPYEQEADRVAAQVMRTPDRTSDASPSVQGFAGHDFGQIALSPQLKLTDRTQPGQTQVSQLATSITPYVQRDALPNMEEIEETESAIEVNASELSSVEEEEKLLQTKPALQQSTEGKVEAEHYLERQLAQSRGGGSPLPDETRSFMEARFGTDFSQVRVHTDAAAVQMNQALQAQAFTHGQDIYFGENQVPGKNDLTAHELTHTIQQIGHSATYRPEPSLDSPMSGDFEQFGSASHRWGASSSQIQKQPISVAQAFSIQRRAGSLTQAEDNQGAKQTKSDAIIAPSMRDERPSEPSIPEGAASTKENPYKSQPTTENKPASSQNNAQNIKQNHKIAPPTSTGSAANDPDFQAVAARGQEVAQAQQQHDPAESESKEAQDAAQAPSNEVTSKAQDRQVGEMAEQQPGEFNAQAFKDAIFEELKTAMPGNLEAAENFDQNNDLDSVRQKVSSDVGAERDEAAAPIEETTQEEPDPSGIEPKLETPMQPPDRGVAPGAIGAERATPKPKSDAEVSQPLEANQQAVDQRMAEADITEEQLANANEPEFSAALDARREVKADAEQAPAAYRQQEQTTLSQAQAEAQTTAATQLEGMHNQRQDSMAQVEGLQGETKSADEQKRTEIADHINGIYERVKGEVETSLSTLETDVTTKFDTAANTARQEFEDYIKREKGKFLVDRYVSDPMKQGQELADNVGGAIGAPEWLSDGAGYVLGGANVLITGGGRVINDAFTGLPPEVEQIFAKGREQYLADMSVALDEIATTVATRLNEAMQKIKGGREDIRKYVDSLDPNLRQIGQEAATSIESKFDDLEQQVRDKHDQLVDTLAQKYQEHLKEIDSRIEEMIAENRGLFDRAMDAIGGVIQTINEIKAMLQGLLADAMTAIGMILRDPIGFLDNLLKALNQGFNQFLENIGKHLQSGLIGWLTGAIGTAGIQMPENIFSLEGIFSLAAQILGLGWDFIRDKAIGMFGESTVGEMEESVDIFQILKNDGLKGLWQQVQSQFTDLKETVMDEVQSIITVEVMQAGVTWILSLFSPASAFIRAAKMIVDVVIFFVENASQIMELVQAVIQSITAIASGSIGAAANAIESALAKAIPVLIGLLASLLGLGGLANKVRDVFERLRKRIEDAIGKLLQKAKELLKGKDKEKEKDENQKKDESDRDPDVDPINKTNEPDGKQPDEESVPVDLSKPRQTGKQKDNPDSTADSARDGKGNRRDQDSDVMPDAKRDQRDDQDLDALRRDKSDQPDQRRHDQDNPEQQRRRDRDQDSDSCPDGKHNRDGENRDRRPDDDRTDDEIANLELYHQRLARQAVEELEEGEPKDYDTVREETEAKARQIETDYTRRLKRGIRLRVHFENIEVDAQDEKLNFRVVIAPNDTELSGGRNTADLEGAEKALAKIIFESDNTEEVREQFDTVKDKYHLSNIDWVKLGKETVSIIVSKKSRIEHVDPGNHNSDLILSSQMETRSTDHCLKESVKYESGTIRTPSGSHPVGRKMTAERLSPDHLKGEKTGDRSLWKVRRHLPTSIKHWTDKESDRRRKELPDGTEEKPNKLLEKLPIKLSTYADLPEQYRQNIRRKKLEKIIPIPEENQYVAGHLLNYNLGGPNDDRNLYPITQAANAEHSDKVEEKVKEWSDAKRYWVYYEVKVQKETIDYADEKLKDKNSAMTVDADFVCKAYVLDVTGKPIRSSEFSVDKTIHSKFSQEAGSTEGASTLNSQSNQVPAIEPSNFEMSLRTGD